MIDARRRMLIARRDSQGTVKLKRLKIKINS